MGFEPKTMRLCSSLQISLIEWISIVKMDYIFIHLDVSCLVSTPSFAGLARYCHVKGSTEFKRIYYDITTIAALDSLYLVMSIDITKCIVCNLELTGKQTKYCSKRCKDSRFGANSYKCQRERAISRKLKLVQLLGGCCSLCGYKKNLAALEFHHVNPLIKDFRLDSRHLSNTSMKKILLELQKCVLLCANCHRELHNPCPEGIL